MSQTPVFIPGQLYRHVDGGLYRALFAARHTNDASAVVAYEHLWPFEPGECWVRPAVEWTPERYTPVAESVLAEAVTGDRAQAQAAVTAHKAARRWAAINVI